MLPIILKDTSSFDRIGICLLESVTEDKFTEEDVQTWESIINEYGVYIYCLLKTYQIAYNESTPDEKENGL